MPKRLIAIVLLKASTLQWPLKSHSCIFFKHDLKFRTSAAGKLRPKLAVLTGV